MKKDESFLIFIIQIIEPIMKPKEKILIMTKPRIDNFNHDINQTEELDNTQSYKVKGGFLNLPILSRVIASKKLE